MAKQKQNNALEKTLTKNKRFKIKNSDDIERIKRENNKDKSI
ncbi:hypothetical protein HPHPH16_0915 [Helicobacter pylori Hp H-16]|nr:hypothetical protein HPHPH16_0628 [Helicobacter pylori Hp H-16]EJB50741.1 hypothetical protein HPHPH16_0915 [Helicobacter pylori Hp H-16]